MCALVRGHPRLGTSTAANHILNEYSQVMGVASVRPQGRRWLLQVLYSSRALDTALCDLVQLRVHRRPTSIGRALSRLVGEGLDRRLADQYQLRVANVRNHYLHRADVHPASEQEVAAYLADMEQCLATVLGRF